MNTPTPEPLYDVLIVVQGTHLVQSIIGSRMRLDDGHFCAKRRAEIVTERVNDGFYVVIVPTGSHNVDYALDERKVVK